MVRALQANPNHCGPGGWIGGFRCDNSHAHVPIQGTFEGWPSSRWSEDYTWKTARRLVRGLRNAWHDPDDYLDDDDDELLIFVQLRVEAA